MKRLRKLASHRAATITAAVTFAIVWGGLLVGLWHLAGWNGLAVLATGMTLLALVILAIAMFALGVAIGHERASAFYRELDEVMRPEKGKGDQR